MIFKHFLPQHSLIAATILVGSALGTTSIAQQASDTAEGAVPYPLIPNNGMYPRIGEYYGSFNEANLDYPTELPASMWNPGAVLQAPLTQDTALDYMLALKDFIEPDMRTLVENHQDWDAEEAGWYNMVWRGAGQPDSPINPILGREVIMNTNTGQIVPNRSWHEDYRPKPEWTQNYGVIYYNNVAAFTLGQVFEDVFAPQPEKMRFLDGSIVVKVEASTVQPEDWPWFEGARQGSVLGDAAMWNVYRPTTQNQKDFQRDPEVELKNVVQSVYPFQLAIKVRDSVASPETGWVYMGFVYDARSEGEGAWDRFIPAGMMWGNDPVEGTFSPDDPDINQSWINPAAPPFVEDTLGWQGRFAAPMDVAVRHNVTFLLPETGDVDSVDPPPEDGFRVSSCLSCHGSAQTPYSDNLYPSPSLIFPPDGDLFPLYWPGTPEWNRWYQNRPGDVPMTDTAVALDYDLSSMIALEIARGTTFAEDALVGNMNGH